jgi:hypothetical protein
MHSAKMGMFFLGVNRPAEKCQAALMSSRFLKR